MQLSESLTEESCGANLCRLIYGQDLTNSIDIK